MGDGLKQRTVHDYYKSLGWSTQNGIHRDTLVNENLQRAALQYNTDTRRRVLHILRSLPKARFDSLLDCGSGPIQYPEYLEYSRLFTKRVCIDFSETALQAAKVNLINDSQPNGEFICADFLDLKINDNSFDVTISLHTLYHIQLEKQKEFVEKLIAVTKPDGLVIVVYSNPFSLRSLISIPKTTIMRSGSWLKGKLFGKKIGPDGIYFKRHRRQWWTQFNKLGQVSFFTYRLFTPALEKKCIPDNDLGRRIYKILFRIEECKFSLAIADYYMIVIRKFP
jgi:ubiquinone/menaquinone biosynthesis C-methylase UbiE